MEPGDAALIRACRHGDQAAWEMLVRRYQRLIYAIPSRAGLNADASADVFQEVFATLVQRLDSIDDPDRLAAWLVTTAKRTTWRAVRQARAVRVSETALDTDHDDIPDSAPLPEHVLARLEQQHEVRSALALLDDRCRRLLTMLFYGVSGPVPYSVVAVELGMAEGSIGPVRARCLERLLRTLGKGLE